MTRAEIINWVYARIDEATAVLSVAAIAQSIVENEIQEALNQMVRSLPPELLYLSGSTLTAYPCIVKVILTSPETYSSVQIPIGETVLRILRVRLDYWKKPVDVLMLADDQLYARQFNSYLKATVNHPMAAIVPFKSSYTHVSPNVDFTTQAKCVECFPGPTITEFANYWNYANDGVDWVILNAGSYPGTKRNIYAELMAVESFAFESTPANLLDGLCWLATYRCLSILRLVPEAGKAFEQYAASIGGLKIGMENEELRAA